MFCESQNLVQLIKSTAQKIWYAVKAIQQLFSMLIVNRNLEIACMEIIVILRIVQQFFLRWFHSTYAKAHSILLEIILKQTVVIAGKLVFHLMCISNFRHFLKDLPKSLLLFLQHKANEECLMLLSYGFKLTLDSQFCLVKLQCPSHVITTRCGTYWYSTLLWSTNWERGQSFCINHIPYYCL